MMDLTAMICPHSSVPEKKLKAILSFFGPVKIGQPWFMDKPVPLSEAGAVQVLHPPEDLKPSADFRKLLAECREWIRTNYGKGFDAIQAFTGEKLRGEEASWEIRGELRHKESRLHDIRRQYTLKWHLHLHLFQEMEGGAREAEALLRTLKGKNSPLKGAIEEEGEPPGPLADLPDSEGRLILAEAGVNQVLEAWFSVFEDQLQGEEVLLTLSPPMFQHLCEAWEEWGSGVASEAMEFRAPDFSALDLHEALKAKGRFMNTRDGVLLKEAVLKFLEGNFGITREKMDGIDLKGLAAQNMSIRLKHFYPLKQSSTNKIVRHLSGKTIGLLRGEHCDG